MKPDEIKLKLRTKVCEIIDLVMPLDGIMNRLKNAAVKLWIDLNIYLIDPILNAFTDNCGEIDVTTAKRHFEDALFIDGRLCMNLRELVPDDYSSIKQYIPNKMIVLHTEDLENLFS